MILLFKRWGNAVYIGGIKNVAWFDAFTGQYRLEGCTVVRTIGRKFGMYEHNEKIFDSIHVIDREGEQHNGG